VEVSLSLETTWAIIGKTTVCKIRYLMQTSVLTHFRSPWVRLVLPTKQDRTTNLRRSLLRIRCSPCISNLVSERVRSHQPTTNTERPPSHYKSWKLTLFLPWGALLMTAGFIMREIGAFNISNLGILIASIVLLLSGPPIYSGAAYFILARTLYYIPWLSPLHPGRILTTFIGVDFLIELMVANGAAKAANTSTGAAEQQAGGILIKTALILQACTFAAYVAILAIWHTRAKRANLMTGNLRRVVAVMYASAVLISARCIYRIAEYFEGWTGEL
jgi:hypothetical protein